MAQSDFRPSVGSLSSHSDFRTRLNTQHCVSPPHCRSLPRKAGRLVKKPGTTAAAAGRFRARGGPEGLARSRTSTDRRAIQESFIPSGASSRSNCLTASSLARSISSCSKSPLRPEVPRSGRTCTTFGSARLTLHPPPCEAVWDRRTLLSGLHTLGRKRTAEWPRCRSRLRS